MTDENQFGRYTLDELERQIKEAVREEQEANAKVVLAWVAIAYVIGLIVGALVL